MCESWRPTCIRSLLGLSAGRAGAQEAWVSGLQRALLGPLLGARWGRKESKALAPELPGFAHQLCQLPASLQAAPVRPLSLSFPFCERRKLFGCVHICCGGFQDPPNVPSANQMLHKPWPLIPAQVGSARLRRSLGNDLTMMCLFFLTFFQELTLKLGP